MRKRSGLLDNRTAPPFEVRQPAVPAPPTSQPLPPLPPLPGEYGIRCAGRVHERQALEDWPLVYGATREEAERMAARLEWNRNVDGDFFCHACATDTTPVLVYRLNAGVGGGEVVFTDIAGVVDEVREQLADAEIANDEKRAILVSTGRMLAWQVNMLPEFKGY